MRSSVRTLRCLAAAAFIGPAAVLPARSAPLRDVLTLQESIDRAVQNNARLLLARKDVDVAKTQLRQAKSLFFPKVAVSLNYARYSHETPGLVDADTNTFFLESTGVGTENLYLGRLGFVQTLYAGGKLDYTYRLSKANLKRAESSYDTLRQRIEYETADAFFRLVKLKREEELFRTALQDLAKLLKQADGPHRRLKITAFQAEVRQRVADLKQQEESTRLEYLRAMGVELFSDIGVEGALETAAPDVDLQTALAWAKAHRAALRETQLQEELDELSVDLSLAEQYPVFLLAGGVEQRNERFPLDQSNWNAVLSMNIPIFDGFSSLARVKESRLRVDQSRLRRVQLEDEIESEVRSAYKSLEHWNQEVAAQEREVAQLSEARALYFGSSPRIRGVEERAEYVRWWLDAAVELVEARFQRRLAVARMNKATARPLGGS